MEITGLAEEPCVRTRTGVGLGDVACVVLAQAGPSGGAAEALARAALAHAEERPPDELRLNLLELVLPVYK